MLDKLTNLLGGGILETVRKGVGMFTGDRAERERGYHDESMASRHQFAAEFQVRNRTWFDSLIDGLNRLPRPVIVTMVIYYFVKAVSDPIEFQAINIGLATIPERMWDIAFAIIAFYFVAREFQKSRDKGMALSEDAFNERMRQFDALKARKRDRAAVMEDAQFHTVMADTSKPLSNAAILEWNRRRQ